MKKDNKYDIICIGSGMGSLTVSSLLSQFEGKKVLMLEKHFQPGGYTHSFKRKQGKYHWDVGIHYIGDMQDGGLIRKLMDRVTRSEVKWQKMKEPFEKFVYPNRTFEMYGNEERFRSDLIEQFPNEKEAIERYFRDIKKVSALFGKSMMLKNTPPSIQSLQTVLENSKIFTVKDYMDFYFKSEELKAILVSQWGDYGLPPSKCYFGTHASLVTHYFNGGYYPIGGAGNIFNSVEKVIQEAGGAVLSSTEVTEIIIQDNQAVGVKTKSLRGEKEEREFFAPIIVSCAGAYLTYTKLISPSYTISFKERLLDFYKRERMATSVCLYMGLKEDPSKFGFNGENYWIYSSVDHDKNFEGRNIWIKDLGEIPSFYFSFPSLKDPSAKNHTADVITFTDYEHFAKWKELPWKKRGDEYSELKEKISQQIIDTIDNRFPGFKDIIDYYELSTPITNEHFTSHVDGAIYGLACVPERYDKEKSPWFEAKTPVKGLYLTGADVGGSPGIAGAIMGGLATTLIISEGRKLLKELLSQ